MGFWSWLEQKAEQERAREAGGAEVLARKRDQLLWRLERVDRELNVLNNRLGRSEDAIRELQEERDSLKRLLADEG